MDQRKTNIHYITFKGFALSLALLDLMLLPGIFFTVQKGFVNGLIYSTADIGCERQVIYRNHEPCSNFMTSLGLWYGPPRNG